MTTSIQQPKIWTYDDYLELPDDGNRYELIEGELFVTPAPIPDHQYSAGELFALIRAFVKQHQLGMVWQAPCDVRLSLATIVQPDVFFVRGENLPPVGAKYIEGAPDLVVEVLSPGTHRADKTVKFLAYEAAGVQEYWIVNPTKHQIEVYTLESGTYELLGDFADADVIASKVLAGFEVVTSEIFYRGL